MKKITACVLAAVILTVFAVAPAAAAGITKVNKRISFIKTFNEQVTNAAPEGINFSGRNVRIVDRVKGRDKAVYLQLSDGAAAADIKINDTLLNAGISFDVKFGNYRSNMSVALQGTGKDLTVFKTSKDGAQLHNNYEVRGLQGGGWQNVQILYNSKKKSYSLYINGVCQMSDWVVASGALTDINGFKLIFMYDTENLEKDEVPDVWIDNVCMYDADKGYIRSSDMPNGAYNNAIVEYMPENEKEGETKVYINADFDNAVNGISYTPKNNICEIYKDEAENNSYVKMERTGENTDDVFFNINSSISGKKCVLEMDLKYGKNCLPVMLSVRSKSGVGTNLFQINGGAITAMSNNAPLGRIESESWTRIAAAYNPNTGTFDFYVNGERTGTNLSVPEVIDNDISFFRMYGKSGASKADLYADNIMVYDGSKPEANISETGTQKIDAVTNYGASVIAMLNGKAAFSDYSESVYYGGEKRRLANPVYKENGQLMIPVQVYEDAFGINVEEKSDGSISVGSATTLKVGEKNGESAGRTITLKSEPCKKDGILYIGAEDMMSTIFGKKVLSLERGITVLSLTDPGYSEEETAQISNYLIYEHPTAEQLKETFNTNEAGHPRILADSNVFAELRTNWQADENKQVWGRNVLSSADVLCKNTEAVKFEVIESGNQKRLLSTCRKVYSNAKTLSMAYKLTGDRKYIDRLWLDIDAASNFPNWNPQHPLDVSEMSMGFAIAYDWCYEGWTEEQRTEMETAMLRHGIEPYIEAQYGGSMKWTIVEKNNRGIVNNAGAAVAAMAIFEKSPEKCAELISNAMWGIDNPLECFYPSGEWFEGSAYWGYALDYLTNFISSTMSVFGTDFKMTKAIGLDKTAEFAMYSMGANIADNFHDAASGATTYADCVYWLSNNLNDPDSTNIMLAKAVGKGASQALLWYNPELNGSAELPNDKYFEGEDQYFSMRSSWTDDSATIMMGHAGQGEGGHNHLDSGTFVLDMLGQRWAVDIGSDDYGIKGLDNKATRYLYYRYSPQGHNCVVINPGENDTFYDMNSFCPMEKHEFKEKGGYVIYDMTPAQVNRADKARRGFRLDDNRRSAVVRDEITLTKPNSDVYWFMQTKAEVEVGEDNTVILSQGGKRIKINFITNADEINVTSGAAMPLDGTSSFPEQADNGKLGYKRIAVKMKASGSMYIQAKFVPIGDPSENSPNVNTALDDWAAPAGSLETIPAISDIKVNGRTILGFSPTTVGYEVILEDMNIKPEVTATVEDGLILEKNIDSSSVSFTVKSPSGEMYRTYTISFIPLKYLPDVDGMTRLPVYEIEASSEPEEANPKQNVNDNDLSTRWTSSGDGQYIILDLGNERAIDAVGTVFHWGKERTYTFDIQVSNDKEEWKTVKEGLKNKNQIDSIEVIPFDRVNARYIRMVCHCSNVNEYNNVLEFAALQKKN